MSYTKGRNMSVSIKRETVRGVKEITGFTNGLPWEEFDVKQTINGTFKDESATGTVSALLGEEIESWNADGTIKGKLDADYMLWAIAGAFGTATPTTALGATTWAISVVNSNLLPTHTINVNRGADGWKAITGVSIDKFAISVADNDSTYSVDVKGIKEEAGTTVTPTITKPSRYILPFNFTLGFATSIAGLSSSTAIAQVKSLEFEFMNSIGGEEIYLGSQYRADVPANGRTAMLKCSVVLNATNGLVSQFEAGTKLAFRIDGTASQLPVIGTSTLRPRLTINTGLGLIKRVVSTPRDEYIMYDLEVEIQEAHLCTATLINSIATLQ
jgi:hypothetical protein